MRSRFQHFTDDTREVLVRARREAERLGHELVGPEHVVKAMVEVDPEWARPAMSSLGIDPGQFEAALEATPAAAVNGPRGLSRQMCEVLDLALEESATGADGRVRLEHLLFAVLRQQRSTMAGAR